MLRRISFLVGGLLGGFSFFAAIAPAQQVITTFAGTDWFFTDDGKQGSVAALAQPTGVASDSKGNVYIADSQMNAVTKVDLDGKITLVAGTGLRRSTGDEGPARSAALAMPVSVAVDNAGNLYIAEFLGGRIRIVTPDGNIDTFAGAGKTLGGDGGPAINAGLTNANFLALDPQGNLYVTEGCKIHKIDKSGIINAFAGGSCGYTGDGGPAIKATFSSIRGIAADSQGNIYVSDQGVCRIRVITTDGFISTAYGNGGCAPGTENVSAIKTTYSSPAGLAFDSQGNLYLTEVGSNRVRRIDTNKIVVTIAGTNEEGFSGDGGSAGSATFGDLSSITIDPFGNISVADRDNGRVRKFTYGGNISTIAGTGVSIGDNGAASRAHFANPRDVSFDQAGNMYTADQLNHRIRKITPGGVVTTVAGTGYEGFSPDGTPALSADLDTPQSVVLDPKGNIVFADTYNNRIRRIRTDGTIETIAGTGVFNHTGDGSLATQAALQSPDLLVYDSSGNLYFATQPGAAAGRIRMIGTDNIIRLTAGTGGNPPLGDGGPAAQANLGHIFGLAVDSNGNVYIGDDGNNRIRKVDKNGIITTIAGTGESLTAPDGSIALKSPIAPNPTGGMTFDSRGNLLYTEGSQVREIKTDGTLQTLAGNGHFSFAGDGGLALNASFEGAGDLALDSSGNLFIIDNQSGRIREVLGGQVPLISLSQAGLTFSTSAGASPQPQMFTVVNAAKGAFNFGASVTTRTGGNWLSISTTAGTVKAASPGVAITVSVDGSKLTNGAYYGTVTVMAPGVPNSPQTLTIVVNVAAPQTASTEAILSRGGLIFVATGGAAPAAKAITLSTLSNQTLTYATTASFTPATPWFTIANANGTVTASKPVIFNFQPILTGLAPGAYKAKFQVTINKITKTADLVLIIPPKASVAAGARGATGCTPTELFPVVASLAGGFNVTAAWPIPIEVQVVDDCGNPMLSGTVAASFSTGDAPLQLQNLQSGGWEATWQTQFVATSVQVDVVARMGPPPISGTTQATGALVTNSIPPPSIAAGGVLNAASYQLNVPIAPGSLVSIFGTNLADTVAGASVLPLPTDLNQTEVLVAGQSLPLVFVSSTQINAMIPYNLPVNATSSMLVLHGPAVSLPVPISVLATQSGVFTRDGSGKGIGIIVAVQKDGTQTLVDANTPVNAGDTLVIYATGLGDVEPRVIAGSAAPLKPLSSTVTPVTVTIGQVSAPVGFAGLTPGFTGLYQVNATVPSGVPSGTAPLVLTQGTVSSAPVQIAVK
jgi:uncharacterized protein (TIGR03437 family)